MYLLNGQYSQSATTTHIIAKYENQEKQLWGFFVQVNLAN